MTPTKKLANHAFIDSQNLNLGVRSLGWQIDYKKLRLYLKNKYNVDQAFMFIGLVTNNQKLYTQLQKAGLFSRYIVEIDGFRKSIEYKKTSISGRSKP